MEALAAVAIGVPLLGAAAMMAGGPLLGWRVRDGAGIAIAGSTLAVTCWLATAPGLVVSWMGGWRPVGDLAIGIGLAIDPLGAGTAALAAALTTMALVFSWRYFETIGALFHVLMLLFLGGMVGFALTGDLFNLFVFFELLTTAAYALTAYDVEHEGPLQGSLNFAVTNTIGAFLLLHGVGLLYARTGALNLAQIGAELEGAGPDPVLVASFVLLTAGLFTKAAIVPFHFWLADAHAVAPSPVSVLLSGVMIELGLYGWVRVYWNVFAGPFHEHEAGLRTVLLLFGAVTALVAGAFALTQHHLKRLLAYSSVSHSGLILVGLALLEPHGLAGAALYTLAHGGIKGALFLLAGIVLHRYEELDELELRGRGRGDWTTAALFVVGAMGLAGLPPFGTTLGKQLVEEAAAHHGLGLVVTSTFVVAGGLTAGAVLATVGRVFAGWGPALPAAAELGEEEEEEPETEEEAPGHRTPWVMVAPVVALLAAALAVGLVPALGGTAVATAELVVRPAEYRAAVLGDGSLPLPTAAPVHLGLTGAATGFATVVLALLVAAVALGRKGIARSTRSMVMRLGAGLEGVRELQSGHVGDYVAWMVFGTGLLAGVLLLVVR